MTKNSKIRRITRCLPGLLAALVAATTPLRALEWKQTSATIAVPDHAKQVRQTFAFRNAGPRPVRILSVETSCHCTEATASAPMIPAGGAGEIRVVYTVSGQTGHQEKHVYVQTDESDEAQPLDLFLDIGK